jgi:hypothetical protein
MSAMVTVTAMPVMHEEMHQRARRHQQIRQHAEHMRGMFREQIETCDDKEAAEDNAPFGSPEWCVHMV